MDARSQKVETEEKENNNIMERSKHIGTSDKYKN